MRWRHAPLRQIFGEAATFLSSGAWCVLVCCIGLKRGGHRSDAGLLRFLFGLLSLLNGEEFAHNLVLEDACLESSSQTLWKTHEFRVDGHHPPAFCTVLAFLKSRRRTGQSLLIDGIYGPG